MRGRPSACWAHGRPSKSAVPFALWPDEGPRWRVLFHDGLAHRYPAPWIRALLARQVADTEWVLFRVPFVFSPRAGTEAAAMPDHVPEEVKRDRIERLVEVVQAVARARNARRVGGVEEVLVEGASRTDATLLRGRTRRNTTVNFSGTASPGELVPVRVTGATSTTLSGRQDVLAAA